MGGNSNLFVKSKPGCKGDVGECTKELLPFPSDGRSVRKVMSLNSGRKYSGDKALLARWENYVENSTKTAINVNLSTDEQKSTLDAISNLDDSESSKPNNRGDEVITSVSPPLPILLPPKIRLQILSPVHSRQQIRHEQGVCIQNNTSCAQNDDPSTQNNTSCAHTPSLGNEESASTLYIKKAGENFTQKSSGGLWPQRKQMQGDTSYEELDRMRKAFQRSNLKMQPANVQQMRLRRPSHKTNITERTMSELKIDAPTHNKEFLNNRLDRRRSTKPPASRRSIQDQQFRSDGTKKVKILRRTSDHQLDEVRQDTALSRSSSKKLKVRGLRNFVDTHKPCPPLWAKQFPCRSRYHPDNYLYDFEGFNAPKRPVADMKKCSKKCGRCNRCGVYVDNICQKCSMCQMDCKCPVTTPIPTAEHFLSQLFGPDWSQTQKVEVNGHPVIPDKPRVNLHDASSNNPLKVSKNEKQEEQPVLPSGYDTYTPVSNPPTASPAAYPAYPGYAYGYGTYPPPWPSYYNPYTAPPMPSFYGYPPQPLMMPPSNYYPPNANKNDVNHV